MGRIALANQSEGREEVKFMDKRLLTWCAVVALVPVMMSVFAAVLLTVDSVSELFYYRNLEIFLIWEIAYLSGCALSYRISPEFGWIRSALICWVMTCPFLFILSFIWAGIRVHDGFSGLAYLMISCISWAFSIVPLLVATYLYKRIHQRH